MIDQEARFLLVDITDLGKRQALMIEKLERLVLDLHERVKILEAKESHD